MDQEIETDVEPSLDKILAAHNNETADFTIASLKTRLENTERLLRASAAQRAVEEARFAALEARLKELEDKFYWHEVQEHDLPDTRLRDAPPPLRPSISCRSPD